MADDPRTFWGNLPTMEGMQATMQQMVQQIALQGEQIALLNAAVESLKDELLARDSFADEQRPAKLSLLPAKTGKESFAESKATKALPAVNAKIAKLARSLKRLDALAEIAEEDIYLVIEAHQAGIAKSQIYQHLGWGSAKHTRIIKPVVDALVAASKDQQAI